MRFFIHSVLFFIIACLAGCATTPTQLPSANENQSWESRVQTLSSVQNWDLKALIAIRSQRDAGTATLQWQQHNQNYRISLFGPLGTSSYELIGQPGRVELASADGKHFYANSPEILLAKQTGWKLPVSNLYYWIRGLPVPNLAAQKKLDAYNHLSELVQEGWMIHYLGYTSVNHVDIPSKIFLDNPMLKIKIVIKQWQL